MIESKPKLTANEIVSNWEKLLSIIETKLESPRNQLLLNLYNKYADRISVAPASGSITYHSCLPGGYVAHILNVLDCGMKVGKLWLDMGAEKSWTMDELIFSLMHHDFGKIGTDIGPYYIENTSEWHRKNQGKLYVHNPKLQYMSVPDMGLFMLQSNGISVTENEYLAIKLHDGLYDDGNKPYFMAFDDSKKLKSNLPLILHQADFMAYRIEYEQEKTFR